MPLPPLRSALELAKVRYAIGGSWASTAFGEPRFANNVDILANFTVENVDRLLSALPKTFYAEIGGGEECASPGKAF